MGNGNGKPTPEAVKKAEEAAKVAKAAAEANTNYLLGKLFGEGGPPDGVKFALGETGETVDWGIEEVVRATVQSTSPKFTMNRAFPTCALYVVDDNKQIGYDRDIREQLMTHYYDITDWVVNARFVSNKDNPADMLVLTLENSDGYLTGDGDFYNKQNSQNLFDPPSAEEINQIEDFSNGGFIRSGIIVEFRLGYDANPNALETVFSGVITSVHGEDLVTVECMSHGLELVTGEAASFEEKGYNGGSDMATWYSEASTENVLFYFLAGSDHANTKYGKGFWRFGSPFSNEEANFLSHLGKYYIKSHSDPSLKGTGDSSVSLLSEVGMAYGDRTLQNVYSPVGQGMLENAKRTQEWTALPLLNGGGFNPFAIEQSAGFNPYGMTLWDVLKTLELRHPGFVTAVRNYPSVHGSEATIFFGPTWAPYIFRDASTYQMATNMMIFGKVGGGKTSDVISSEEDQQRLVGAIENQRVLKIPVGGNIRPFKRYHYVTATTDIISNNIRTASQGTAYNAVRIHYHPESVEAKGFQQLSDNTKINTRDIKVSETITGADTNFFNVEEPNAVFSDNALTMGVGYLLRAVKEFYQGELVLVGDEKIRVHDSIIIQDEYAGMVGCVDVGEVEHILDPEMGFITRVKPDMCVNSEADVAGAALNAIMTNVFLKIGLNHSVFANLYSQQLATAPDVARLEQVLSAWEIAGESAGLLGYMGMGGMWAGGYGMLAGAALYFLFLAVAKSSAFLISKYRNRAPVLIQPLLLNGEPYVIGLYGYERPTTDYWSYTKAGWYESSDLVNKNIMQFLSFGG